MPLLLVQDAGPLTTVQDLGRHGHLRVGIPASGPVDREAFVLANRLAGNPDGAAGLECTLIGPRLEFTDARAVAVTGAEMAVTLNGAEAPRWASLSVKAGSGSWGGCGSGCAVGSCGVPRLSLGGYVTGTGVTSGVLAAGGRLMLPILLSTIISL